MSRKCKCKICNAELTTDIAYKRTDVKASWYCCSFEEFVAYNQDIQARSHVISYVFKILGNDTPNTCLYKEIDIWHKYASYEKLEHYFRDNEDYITNILNQKDIETETQRIRYMSAIVKNTINDYKEVVPIEQKPTVEFVPVNDIQPARKKRKGLADIDV